ncbi:FkbM family methyltransferase [Enhygromyxa salina]
MQSVSIEDVSFRVRADADRGLFWDRVNRGHWEPHTFKVFRRFLDPGHSCVDIGAWIGPTALYAAQRAGRVHAIEPDPVAHAQLEANVAANPDLGDRIQLHRQCIAPESGPVDLYAGGMYHSDASAFGDSMSGMVAAPERPGQPSCQVEGVKLVDFLDQENITDCSFIKMDVEGGEYSLIPGHWRQLARFGMPTTCVSFHAPAPALRHEQIGSCIEELSTCYRRLYAASNRAITDLAGRLAAVRDWSDEAPDSPWRALEQLLGDGIVASNKAW